MTDSSRGKVKMNNSDILILGAGMTGMATGIVSEAPIYEAADAPGGICSSYYMSAGGDAPLPQPPPDGEAYRFEIGGGHWIFGGDPAIIHFIRSLVPIQSHSRRSSVYFRSRSLSVPYPLQNHLRCLGSEISLMALQEMALAGHIRPRTMREWLDQSFGTTLTGLFFGPFHERYTAGLWRDIAPQDDYKSPATLFLSLQGAIKEAPPVGYNTTFIYPIDGLDALSRRMAEKCRIRYGKKAIHIDVCGRRIHFADGSSSHYDKLVSTLPLNQTLTLAGLNVEAPVDPHTSVLVLNIGAVRMPGCPNDHWLYTHENRSGFHRVGFYSNVDTSFLPTSARISQDRVSIYVERSYRGSEKPHENEIQVYVRSVIEELQEWGFIGSVEVIHPTWIDVAYTWSWPGSEWKSSALRLLENHGIFQVGRYGRWAFQGIADSIRDGLMVGGALLAS